MKARSKQRRFFRKPVQPNIVVLENLVFTDAEMQDVAALVGKDLFTDELREMLGQFQHAKNFGSLIIPKLSDPAQPLRVLEEGAFRDDLLLKDLQARTVAALRMAEALSSRYHVVVANPPYMGASNANTQLKSWLGNNYPNSKRDLFSAFIDRNLTLCRPSGTVAMITMQNWMFISRFQSVFFKIVVTVFMLSRLFHKLFLFRVQCRRPNRLAVSDGARTPA